MTPVPVPVVVPVSGLPIRESVGVTILIAAENKQAQEEALSRAKKSLLLFPGILRNIIIPVMPTLCNDLPHDLS